MKKLILFLPLILFFPAFAFAQCTANTNPAFSGGGNLWGRNSAQVNQYFTAKVNSQSGYACEENLTNPTIAGEAIFSSRTGVVLQTQAGSTVDLGGNVNLTNLAASTTAPTIASGFGTSPSIVVNGTASGVITVGSSPGNTGTLTMPTAAHGWACSANDVTTTSSSVFLTKETAYTTTSVTFTQYNDAATATAWTAADKVVFQCTGF